MDTLSLPVLLDRIETRLMALRALCSQEALALSDLDVFNLNSWLGFQTRASTELLARIDAILAFPFLIADALAPLPLNKTPWAPIDAGESVIRTLAQWLGVSPWVLQALRHASPHDFLHRWPDSLRRSAQWLARLPPETRVQDWPHFIWLVDILDQIYAAKPCPPKVLRRLRQYSSETGGFARLTAQIDSLLKPDSATDVRPEAEDFAEDADAFEAEFGAHRTVQAPRLGKHPLWSITYTDTFFFTLQLQPGLTDFARKLGLDERPLNAPGFRLLDECFDHIRLEVLLAEVLRWRTRRNDHEKARRTHAGAWPAILPAAFVVGEWQVVELTSTRALIDEGQRLEHCVGSYSLDCCLDGLRVVSIRDAAGSSHSTASFYINPLTHSSNAFSLSLAEHYGLHNTQPAAECQQAVQAYFAALRSADGQAAIQKACQKQQKLLQSLKPRLIDSTHPDLAMLLEQSGKSARWLYRRLAEEEESWMHARDKLLDAWERLSPSYDMDNTEHWNHLLAHGHCALWDDLGQASQRLGLEMGASW